MLHRLFGPFFSFFFPPIFIFVSLASRTPPVYSGTISFSVKKTFFSIKVSARRVLCSSHTWLGWTWWIRQESTGGPATLAARYKFLKTRDLNKKTDWMCTFFLLRLWLRKKKNKTRRFAHSFEKMVWRSHQRRPPLAADIYRLGFLL